MPILTLSTGRAVTWAIEKVPGRPEKLNVQYSREKASDVPTPDEKREASLKINTELHGNQGDSNAA